MFSNSARVVATRLGLRGTAVAATVARSVSTRSTPPTIWVGATSPTLRAAQKLVLFRHLSSAPPAFLDPAEVTDRIVQVVKNFDQVDPLKVSPATKFADDLGLDSLDIVEVVMAIEDEFAIEIPDQEADKILSIADAVEYISTHPMAK